MTINQAFKNLMNLLESPDLRINWMEHNGLRQSLQLLHSKALDGEELKKQVESEKKKEEIKVEIPKSPYCPDCEKKLANAKNGDVVLLCDKCDIQEPEKV